MAAAKSARNWPPSLPRADMRVSSMMAWVMAFGSMVNACCDDLLPPASHAEYDERKTVVAMVSAVAWLYIEGSSALLMSVTFSALGARTFLGASVMNTP